MFSLIDKLIRRTISYSKHSLIIKNSVTPRFDVLVNGGGAVTLQFQRSPFRPMTRTVFVPWNQIVVLPPVHMELVEDDNNNNNRFHSRYNII